MDQSHSENTIIGISSFASPKNNLLQNFGFRNHQFLLFDENSKKIIAFSKSESRDHLPGQDEKGSCPLSINWTEELPTNSNPIAQVGIIFDCSQFLIFYTIERTKDIIRIWKRESDKFDDENAIGKKKYAPGESKIREIWTRKFSDKIRSCFVSAARFVLTVSHSSALLPRYVQI